MFAPLEHEEDGTQNFVADGDDGVFVAKPDDERLELRLEHGLGTAGGMDELAEETADIQVALADVARLALASMSRRGRCHDDAIAESFFQLLKRERIYRKICADSQEVRYDIFDYIETSTTRTVVTNMPTGFLR